MRTRPQGNRFRAAWAALLSLAIPGLGQVFARAWRPAVLMLVLNEALSLGGRVITQLAAPIPPALAAVAMIVVVSIGLMLVAAIDAWRRVRAGPVPPRPRWFQTSWVAALVLVAAGFGLDAVLPFGWRTFSIPSASMAPTLLVGDFLLADARAGYAPARGDVVIFEGPRDPATDFVKRIIALPGDRIAIENGTPVLNGTPLPRTDAGEMLIPEPMSFGTRARTFMETLPGGATYRIAKTADDGPGNTMPEQTIPPGRVFVLGDNRDNSADSRFPAMGTVPVENLIGPARTLYWSGDRTRVLTPVR